MKISHEFIQNFFFRLVVVFMLASSYFTIMPTHDVQAAGIIYSSPGGMETGNCDSCHYLREDGTFSGIPKLESCLDCHTDEPMGDTKDEDIFATEFVAKEREVPWYVYSRQPDCVFFSHAAHIEAAGMDCKSCHGPIAETRTSRPYEENRLTGYSRDIWGKNIWGIKKHSWDSMKMDDCAVCHKEETGHKGYCFQCHK